ncbi:MULTISPECIES: ABC transporter ATP-binding protein [unclassified Paenibacillus]|uniref:ABC transporter ATP-binding protein n=1 Tax=unclassified Paenibacillus TaxID=185978 RepID=UPI0010483B22|nr:MULTISPECIES: ABC transporter ATP-binding protein [unclassified Paenibacillus]NIK68412.1 ABC-2 type transport system ATP-binding protein [Paenibacillus sp. BK720]TCM99301.1 ABC-2 type transport system ATP-binding protein [Paenibacillus sp. BK033]
MTTAKITNPSIVLQLDGLTKKIGSKAIVNGLSFDIAQGEVVGLLGPNGAGKTTTMRMIVGLIGMSEGDVRICGQSVRTNFEKAIRHVGGIIENPEFYPYMTGYDNLKQYQRMTEGVTDARIEEVTKLVGMQEALGKKVKAYSLGMRQRLGIAQALLHEPKLLILDEPTNGLDPAGIKEMREYLKRIAESEGIAILVSSHLLSEIELMCSRVIVIQEGKFVTARSIGETESPKQKVLTISMQVGNAGQAQEAISHVDGVEVTQTDSFTNRITVKLLHDQIPGLVAKLAAEGVAIYRIEEVRATLEEEFMKLTGGNRIA